MSNFFILKIGVSCVIDPSPLLDLGGATYKQISFRRPAASVLVDHCQMLCAAEKLPYCVPALSDLVEWVVLWRFSGHFWLLISFFFVYAGMLVAIFAALSMRCRPGGCKIRFVNEKLIDVNVPPVHCKNWFSQCRGRILGCLSHFCILFPQERHRASNISLRYLKMAPMCMVFLGVVFFLFFVCLLAFSHVQMFTCLLVLLFTY